ncbi:MAG: FAD-binding protein [Promethearchaeota archaeon]|jgi:succinate dehydrogenase / fumarate reductase flavoprotein subunit
MSYPDNMKKSIELVEETREQRLTETIKRIDPENREMLLKKYHPDYKEGAKRIIRVGVNKGEIMITGFADILEAYPLIDPDSIDLSKVDFDVDVLIIGGGVAGCIASLWANNSGIEPENILIAQKLRLGDSNTKMATGGMQMAVGPDDDPIIHYLDTIGGGHFANKPRLQGSCRLL